MTSRASLIELLKERSVRYGEFTLASGRTSEMYIDARLTTMSPEGLALIGPLGLATIRRMKWNADSIGGLTLGADPVAYAVSYASFENPPFVRAFTVRKEPKQHGTRNLIEGPFRKGDRVVVVEDVVTSGASALKAIDVVRIAGGEVVGVMAIVDRREGGTEKLKAAGFSLVSLVEGEELKKR
jgi:orotate phosphoribosyltransferase